MNNRAALGPKADLLFKYGTVPACSMFDGRFMQVALSCFCSYGDAVVIAGHMYYTHKLSSCAQKITIAVMVYSSSSTIAFFSQIINFPKAAQKDSFASFFKRSVNLLRLLTKKLQA